MQPEFSLPRASSSLSIFICHLHINWAIKILSSSLYSHYRSSNKFFFNPCRLNLYLLSVNKNVYYQMHYISYLFILSISFLSAFALKSRKQVPLLPIKPTLDVWTTTPSTSPPKARYGHSSVVYNNEVIIFAGCDAQHHCFNDLQSYNPSYKFSKFTLIY